DLAPVEARLRGDPLARSGGALVEGGPEGRVAGGEPPGGSQQGRNRQETAHPRRPGDGVGRGPGGQAVEEPERPLAMGQLDLLFAPIFSMHSRLTFWHGLPSVDTGRATSWTAGLE